MTNFLSSGSPGTEYLFKAVSIEFKRNNPWALIILCRQYASSADYSLVIEVNDREFEKELIEGLQNGGEYFYTVPYDFTEQYNYLYRIEIFQNSDNTPLHVPPGSKIYFLSHSRKNSTEGIEIVDLLNDLQINVQLDLNLFFN